MYVYNTCIHINNTYMHHIQVHVLTCVCISTCFEIYLCMA